MHHVVVMPPVESAVGELTVCVGPPAQLTSTGSLLVKLSPSRVMVVPTAATKVKI